MTRWMSLFLDWIIEWMVSIIDAVTQVSFKETSADIVRSLILGMMEVT